MIFRSLIFRFLLVFFTLFFAGTALTATRAETVTIGTSKDNTLIESATGNLSNGIGPLFAGRTGQSGPGALRALLAFDVAADIPAGAVITDVELTLNILRAGGGAGNDLHNLHAVTQDWGEGTSVGAGGGGGRATPTDATWIHTFFDTATWDRPGGDFRSEASASQTIGLSGMVTWESTPGLVADVQSWLDDPTSNFGWILLGNEQQNSSSRQFASRDVGNNPPQLTISFLPVPEPGSLTIALFGFCCVLARIRHWN